MLFVTGAYAPEFSAGGLQCAAVARALDGAATIRVLTTATNASLPAQDSVDGISVTRVHVELGRLASSAIARMAAALARLLPGSDVVHIQGYSTKNILVQAMARLFRRPVIVHLQTAKHDEPQTIRPQGRLAWWAFASADRYIAVSEGLRQRYLEGGLPPERIEVIPNGVDIARFRPATVDERAALRDRLGLPVERPLILFVGVMSVDKQPHVLLDAWARAEARAHVESTLVFVGATDPRLFELEDRIGEQMQQTLEGLAGRDRVRFVAPTRLIEHYYRAADVLVMPSIREGLPNVILEAMASGLAVIASRLPGSTDTMIADGVNGRLVEPADVNGFAVAIAEMLTDRGKASLFGAQARRTAEDRYQIGIVARQWLAAYEQLLNHGRGAQPAS